MLPAPRSPSRFVRHRRPVDPHRLTPLSIVLHDLAGPSLGINTRRQHAPTPLSSASPCSRRVVHGSSLISAPTVGQIRPGDRARHSRPDHRQSTPKLTIIRAG